MTHQKKRNVKDVRVHMYVCIELCEVQCREGMCFLHGHPLPAASWKEPVMIVFSNVDGVMRAGAHVCRNGVTQQNGEIPTFVKKPAGILDTFAAITNELDKCCDDSHQHVTVQGSNGTRQAQIRPEDSCDAICRGVREQREMDTVGPVQLRSINHIGGNELEEPMVIRKNCMQKRIGWTHGVMHRGRHWSQRWPEMQGKTRLNISVV